MHLSIVISVFIVAFLQGSEAADRCHLPADSGLCDAYFLRFHFNANLGSCQEFVYGGCGGNSNNFLTSAECEQACKSTHQETKYNLIQEEVCQLNSEVGPCRAAIPRFFHNKKSGRCEKFYYGGCAGNANNFATEEECTAKCPQVKKYALSNVESVCQLPAKTGLCEAYFPRYFFNAKNMKCERFIYGGCNGNGNNFNTIEECESVCQHTGKFYEEETKPICEQEMVTGPCRALFKRFYYNRSSGTCEQFVYGGCRGNQNNFITIEECQKTCA